MKTIAIAALFGIASALDTGRFYYHPQYVEMEQSASSSSGSSSSSSSSSEDENMMVRDDDGYPAYMSGFGGYHTYIRDTPDRFESEADDTLMRSMYDTYATEGMNADGTPNGQFWVTKENAKKAAGEIVGTHLLLLGDAQKKFVDEVFPAAWARYDVNEEGKIEADRMPIFLRHICGNTEACIGM